ncbi:hypothetical protein AAFP30_20620 [Gordonia sp. CPCC 205515]|uniref:hypothetical protein n=1 Tax=Gordonia sp. CPCC 205515 TaxID=3140791 RepID=UPI003AF3834D
MTENLPDSSRPLDADERAELERLRAEVAELEAARPEPQPHKTSSGLVWRRIGAGFLVFLCALLALLSVTTRFVRSELLDTDHYVNTVSSLASNPAVQAQVVNSVTDQINEQVDIEAATKSALQQIVDLTPAERPRLDNRVVGLAPVIAAQAESYIRKAVTEFVQSPQFADLWVAANRSAHEGVVATVTGDTKRGAVEIDPNGTISIQLGPIVTQVKDRLEQRGFSFADNIPNVNKEFVIFQSPELAKINRWVNALDKIATILPWLAIAAALGAIALIGRGRRLRMTAIVGVSIVLSMLILAIGILVGRAIYLNEVPANVLAPDAAKAIFDTVIAPLRTALRAVAVLALIVAIAAFFAGGSRSATATRHAFSRGIGAVDSHRAQRPPNSFERALWQARIPLRIAVVAIAALILMFWSYPTGLVVIWTVVIAVLVLIVLELLMRPARRTPGDPQVTVAEDDTPTEKLTDTPA